MSSIFTPINQVKLTNVSYVRLKKGGKRFELACYKNKVQEYRNKVTRDLDEVLQIHNVFLNVSKGQVAKEADLLSSFGTSDIDKVILEILQKGDMQVGSEERGQQLQMLSKEIATIIADKCVNPRTKTPYPVSIIEQAMSEMHLSPALGRPAKQQALEMIKTLCTRQEKFPIARAQMRLSLDIPLQVKERVLEAVRPMLAEIEEDIIIDERGMIQCLIDPGQFRLVTDAVTKLTKGSGMVKMLNLKDLKDSCDTVNDMERVQKALAALDGELTLLHAPSINGSKEHEFMNRHRPWSQGDYIRRVRTFNWEWSSRPRRCDVPTICRYGWVQVQAREGIECSMCKGKLLLPWDDEMLPETQQMVCEEYLEMVMKTGHVSGCPWTLIPCPTNITIIKFKSLPLEKAHFIERLNSFANRPTASLGFQILIDGFVRLEDILNVIEKGDRVNMYEGVHRSWIILAVMQWRLCDNTDIVECVHGCSEYQVGSLRDGFDPPNSHCWFCPFIYGEHPAYEALGHLYTGNTKSDGVNLYTILSNFTCDQLDKIFDH